MDLDKEELEATKNKRKIKCNFCNAKVFVQVERLAKPLLAPLTEVGQLQYELINKTGIDYMQIKNIYCPMCGRKLV